MVMEYAPQGRCKIDFFKININSLANWISKQNREIPASLIYMILKEIAEGMNFLHTRKPPIIHRDLKSHNILVTM